MTQSGTLLRAALQTGLDTFSIAYDTHLLPDSDEDEDSADKDRSVGCWCVLITGLWGVGVC